MFHINRNYFNLNREKKPANAKINNIQDTINHKQVSQKYMSQGDFWEEKAKLTNILSNTL